VSLPALHAQRRRARLVQPRALCPLNDLPIDPRALSPRGGGGRCPSSPGCLGCGSGERPAVMKRDVVSQRVLSNQAGPPSITGVGLGPCRSGDRRSVLQPPPRRPPRRRAKCVRGNITQVGDDVETHLGLVGHAGRRVDLVQTHPPLDEGPHSGSGSGRPAARPRRRATW
jgi:hypothetical protein